MKRKLIYLGLLLALVPAIMVNSVACSSAANNNEEQTATVNSIVAPTNQVPTTNLKQSDIALRITVDGRLSFVEHKKLTFGTGGKVGHVNVSELDSVTKGQVLAKLDTTSLEQAVKAADLALKSTEFDRQLAENGIKSAEVDLKTAQGNLEAIKIDLEQATDNFRKITYPYTYNTVYIDVPTALGFINDARNEINKAMEAMKTGEPGEVSFQLHQVLDNLIKSRDLLSRHGYGSDVFASEFLPMDKFWTLRAAQLQVDRVQLAVVNAENVVSKTALAVENTRTALNKVQLAEDKAKNDLDRALDELEKAVITAPFDGVIAKLNVEEGDFLSVNYATTIAVEIIDPSRMELNFYISELDIPNVKLGQKVSISVDALPDVHLDSVVTSISTLPIVQFGVLSYEVKVVFDVPQDSALRSGMSVTADIINDKKS